MMAVVWRNGEQYREDRADMGSMNKGWFEIHKHLTNEEMLAKGLIDKCDFGWVDALREENGGQ
jgi:hypothetical protein